MRTHFKKGCGFEGFMATHSKFKKNVDCSRCRIKYKLDMEIQSYIVKVGKYLNVIALEHLTEDMEILSTLTFNKFPS